jgi:hypothetical protein
VSPIRSRFRAPRSAYSAVSVKAVSFYKGSLSHGHAAAGAFYSNLARIEHATLQTAKFPFVFASKLKIRQYICVFRLRRYENFARFKFKEVCAAAFFQSARHEFAERLTPFKNECKTGGKRRRVGP